LTIAANQLENARSLSAAGVATFAGRHGTLLEEELVALIRRLADDARSRRSLSERGMALVDGLGAARVATAIDGVRLRRATFLDANALYRWANDPVTRASSFQSGHIDWEHHVAWLRDRLHEPTTTLLIGVSSQGAVGQVRFESHNDVDEISISVAPEQRGLGVGRLILLAALRWQARVRPRRAVRARVKAENLASQRMFDVTGFRIVGASKDALEYLLEPPPRLRVNSTPGEVT
jgi:RimJ/RimL family protein N-acetyltransferase